MSYRMPFVSSLRGAPVLNLGGGPLFVAREEALYPEPERRPCLLNPREGKMYRALEESLCVQSGRRSSLL